MATLNSENMSKSTETIALENTSTSTGANLESADTCALENKAASIEANSEMSKRQLKKLRKTEKWMETKMQKRY
jgi:hypothetical protein